MALMLQMCDLSQVQGPNRMKQAESEQADIDVSTSGKRSSQALRPLQHFHAARAPARVAGALLSAGRMPLQVCSCQDFPRA